MDSHTMRMRAVDAVEPAGSGHPGAPMGTAPAPDGAAPAQAIARFAESAPAGAWHAHFGITAERVQEPARARLGEASA
jgi:transketolase